MKSIERSRWPRRRSGSDARRRDATLPACLPWKPDSVACPSHSTSQRSAAPGLAVHHLPHSKTCVTASPVQSCVPRHISISISLDLGHWPHLCQPPCLCLLASHWNACTMYSQELCQWENYVQRARSHANVGGTSPPNHPRDFGARG
jgi:hypothetical protein